MSNPVNSEIRLANNWPVTKVDDCLTRQARSEIIHFLRERHEERFFDPIRHLTASCNKQGYGFAIMALCFLLIETIQCYRCGLPGTPQGKGRTIFKAFFAEYVSLFPNVDGEKFYLNIRNGLLHQAETKDGWTIRTGQPSLCNWNDKIIDRDKFADALKKGIRRLSGRA